MEQRYDAVTMVMRDGFSITDVAAKFNVSRQTVYRWLAKYEEGGLEALADESHRPHHVPHQMGGVVEVRVLDMRRRHHLWGPKRIAFELKKEGFDPPPSHMAIYRAPSLGARRQGRTTKGPQDLQALGTRTSHGALADGRRGIDLHHRRHRSQDLDGH
jgi:transposase